MMKFLALAAFVSGVVLEVKAQSCTAYEGTYTSVSGSGCSQFKRCVNAVWTSAMDCPPGTLFNEFISGCDHEANVNVTNCEPYQNLGTGIDCTGADLTKAITVLGDCSKYYYCTDNVDAVNPSRGITAANEYSCWGSTLFNLDVQLCVQANQVDVATCTTA